MPDTARLLAIAREHRRERAAAEKHSGAPPASEKPLSGRAHTSQRAPAKHVSSAERDEPAASRAAQGRQASSAAPPAAKTKSSTVTDGANRSHAQPSARQAGKDAAEAAHGQRDAQPAGPLAFRAINPAPRAPAADDATWAAPAAVLASGSVRSLASLNGPSDIPSRPSHGAASVEPVQAPHPPAAGVVLKPAGASALSLPAAPPAPPAAPFDEQKAMASPRRRRSVVTEGPLPVPQPEGAAMSSVAPPLLRASSAPPPATAPLSPPSPPPPLLDDQKALASPRRRRSVAYEGPVSPAQSQSSSAADPPLAPHPPPPSAPAAPTAAPLAPPSPPAPDDPRAAVSPRRRRSVVYEGQSTTATASSVSPPPAAQPQAPQARPAPHIQISAPASGSPPAPFSAATRAPPPQGAAVAEAPANADAPTAHAAVPVPPPGRPVAPLNPVFVRRASEPFSGYAAIAAARAAAVLPRVPSLTGQSQRDDLSAGDDGGQRGRASAPPALPHSSSRDAPASSVDPTKATSSKRTAAPAAPSATPKGPGAAHGLPAGQSLEATTVTPAQVNAPSVPPQPAATASTAAAAAAAAAAAPGSQASSSGHESARLAPIS
jgi:hypothetical protein